MVTAETVRTEEVPAVVRLGGAVVLGLVMGAVTSVLQKYLDLPWLSLVNAASPWLAPAFAVGVLQRRVGGAALAGLATCVFELVGYYLTSAARVTSQRGRPRHPAVLDRLRGGRWSGVRRGRVAVAQDRVRGLGASVLVASFLAEAAVSYGWRLHYTSSAILFAVIGVVAAVLVGERVAASTCPSVAGSSSPSRPERSPN